MAFTLGVHLPRLPLLADSSSPSASCGRCRQVAWNAMLASTCAPRGRSSAECAARSAVR